MNRKEMIVKYTRLQKNTDKTLKYFNKEMKEARSKMATQCPLGGDSGLNLTTNYEDAKREYLFTKQVSQIYGQICFELGDF